jgi:hypothetical protein
MLRGAIMAGGLGDRYEGPPKLLINITKPHLSQAASVALAWRRPSIFRRSAALEFD